jgi:hypothetical protein
VADVALPAAPGPDPAPDPAPGPELVPASETGGAAPGGTPPPASAPSPNGTSSNGSGGASGGGSEAPLAIDLDALTTGDLEDMEDYCGRPVLPTLQEASEAAENDATKLVTMLPTRMLTALLGVTKRWADPSFTPDRWRSIKLSELYADPSPAEAAARPPARGANRAARRARPSKSPSGSQRKRAGKGT